MDMNTPEVIFGILGLVATLLTATWYMSSVIQKNTTQLTNLCDALTSQNDICRVHRQEYNKALATQGRLVNDHGLKLTEHEVKIETLEKAIA